MSLLTFQEVRPWARAIKQRVRTREMPPWGLSADPGTARFKNDRSLTEDQIRTIEQWVDAGAPFGDPNDLPPPIAWPHDDDWQLGLPDVVISVPLREIAATGPDTWNDYILDTGLVENRYVRAVETKPSSRGRTVVHHVVAFVIQNGSEDDSYLSEYAVGKEAEIFPASSGRLISAGAKLRINVHDHPSGAPVSDRLQIGLFLYPPESVPRHHIRALTVGLLLLDDDLDIPPHAVTTHRAQSVLAKPVRVLSFQPHMHLRGKSMVLEAVLPDGARRRLGEVDRFEFGLQTAYIYEDNATPLLPAGTVLYVEATFDNTSANRTNPDPDQWVGFGNRSVDEMLQCHVMLIELEDNEYAGFVSRHGAR